MSHRVRQLAAFTLVELLVVIGIIAVLISMLLPALQRSRQQANAVSCKSNMHQIALEMQMYANTYKGWLYPVWNLDPASNKYITLGTNWPPNKRWPTLFFTFQHPDPDSAPYNAWTGPFNPPINNTQGTYTGAYDPVAFDPIPWTPPVMRCPADLDCYEGHSYIVNQHLEESPTQVFRASSSAKGMASGRVVILGEKKTVERDYYMEADDFDRVVELFRHGAAFGSNYLYSDWSVDNVPTKDQVMGALDPWAIAPTTAPSP